MTTQIKKRPFQTDYMFNGVIIKSNTAGRDVNAVMRCIYHMSSDTYGANYAIVHCLETGKVYCEVDLPIGEKEINITYRRKLKKPTDRKN